MKKMSETQQEFNLRKQRFKGPAKRILSITRLF